MESIVLKIVLGQMIAGDGFDRVGSFFQNYSTQRQRQI